MAKAPKAKRFAQALFELAQQHNAAEHWQEELAQVAAALSVDEVAAFLASPRARAEDKRSIVTQVTTGRHPIIANFVGLLADRQAVGLVGQIVDEYTELLNAAMDRISADVTAATSISSAQEQRLRTSLGTSLQKTVVLNVHEDPEIIGGLVVRVGDQIIDGSVRTKLASMKQRLEQESLR